MDNQFEVQASYTEKVMELFRSHPHTWIPAPEIATVGGFCGWRTRVSNARERFEKEDWTIVWNNKARSSAYMLREKPLGRDAETKELGQRRLFGGSSF